MSAITRRTALAALGGAAVAKDQEARPDLYHVEHDGYPSEFSFKDVMPLFRGEKFDLESLVSRCQKAGSRYFFALAVPCDNFDFWNSRHQRWNAVNMGPKRDVIGTWRQAARKAGLKFGLCEHMWGSYNWFSTNKLADEQGLLAGVLRAKRYSLRAPPAGQIIWASS